MQTIRFIQIGPSNNTEIHNLVPCLNSIQFEYQFSFDNDLISYPKSIRLKQHVPTATLEKMTIEYAANKSFKEYPVAICDCSLEDELFSSNDKKSALISTYNFIEDVSPYSNQTVIAYLLATILLDLHIETPSHIETKGCPNDYCDNRKDIKVGLSKSDFCSDCNSKILRAVTQGQITLSQIVAIYKILDFVARRKICFVLMPFESKFNKVYIKYIQPIFNDNNWMCIRADEIHQTREIVNLICEQILRADLIIADLTGRNPNVFYELGYSHAMAKNTVLITQSIKDVPFDLRHRQLVKYSANVLGYKKLVESIKKYL